MMGKRLFNNCFLNNWPVKGECGKLDICFIHYAKRFKCKNKTLKGTVDFGMEEAFPK